jgi:radical SAM superfamily enzyme YgiQ (UPF0313 family)
MRQVTMAWKTGTPATQPGALENGAVHKDWRGRVRIALIYPNRYHVGMANLGFQQVYRLFNAMDDVVCERAFLPPPPENRQKALITTIESGRPLADFDIIAFSLSFESDYLNILSILAAAGIPFFSSDRPDAIHPLVIAGGVACWLNPEPISPFIDCFLIGEAEAVLPPFMTVYDPGMGKRSLLKNLAQQVSGVYVPSFYKVSYKADGTVNTVEALCDVPEKIVRVYVKDLSETATCSAILTPEASFGNSFLVEVSRGCPHGCRFCSAGYIYRPPRFRPRSLLEQCLQEGAVMSDQIGLVGAAVSDLPEVGLLCKQALLSGCRLSFSSLRADALRPELIDALRQSGVKTATIAPDAGSERMRRVINKGITEEDILHSAEILVAEGIPNLKLYFMLGLPTETPEDVEAVVGLCKRIKQRFLQSSRVRGRIGEITVSLSSFVPKPVTPFQWVPMAETGVLKKKIRQIKSGLGGVANVKVLADVPRAAYIQALLSRGDRQVSKMLVAAHNSDGNWPQAFKASPLNADFYVHRLREPDERFPWDFMDHGIKKEFLFREYQRAIAEKVSPVCPMRADCTFCGVCGHSSPDLD